MYATLYEDVLYEVFKLESGFKIIIYLKKVGDIFINSNKAFGNYFIEQTFDSNDNLITGEIKKNPYFTDCNDLDFDDDYD